jgi:hypothetical protein
MARILDCGHEPSPHGPHTTGTARTQEGTEICWDCALANERDALLTERKFTAYLVRDAKSREWFVTTWPGGLLMDVTRIYKGRRATWRGYQPCYYFRARDVHGQDWVGQGEGEGVYCRLRRAA